MRNFIQPIIKEIGTITIRGRDYHMQTISYGSQHHVHVFRKQAPHKRGLVFLNTKDYIAWLNNNAQQNLPFGEISPQSAQ